MSDLPTLAFASRQEWEAWLDAEHKRSDGVWLKLAKKGVAGVSYPQAVEVALCYGWIDGQARTLDDTHWLQRYTPRRRASRWSKINRDKAQALIDNGKMQPAGLHEVERAKTDGRWNAAYAGARAATVPDDLQRALDADPEARAFFGTLDSAYGLSRRRRAALHDGAQAPRPTPSRSALPLSSRTTPVAARMGLGPVVLQRPEADIVVLVLGEQQRRQAQRVRWPQLDARGVHLAVDDLNHDVRAADDDELAALVEPQADVVIDEALGAVGGVHGADEFGALNRAQAVRRCSCTHGYLLGATWRDAATSPSVWLRSR